MSNSDLIRAFAVPVLLVLIRLVSPSEAVGEIAYILVPAWSAGQLLRRRLRGDCPSAAWGLLTGGFACLAIAEFYWYSEDLFDIEYYPGPGEYLNALALLVMTVGFWRTTARVAPVGDKTGIIDATVLALATAVLAWVAIAEPASRSNRLSGDEQAWLMLLLGLDVLLLGTIARLGFSLRARPPAYLFLYLGAGGLVLLDGLESVFEVTLGIQWGGTGDVLEMMCYACWGLAALLPDRAERASANSLHYLGVRRVAALGAGGLVPLSALVVQDVLGVPMTFANVAVLGTAGLAIGLLVMIRMCGLIAAVRELADERGKERFAALVDNSSDVILSVDRALQVSYASPALHSIWGHAPEAVVGNSVQRLFSPSEVESLRGHLERAAASRRGTLEFESMVLRADGGLRDCEVVAANLTDHPAVGELVLTLRDITDRKNLERELRHQAFHDSLTGLANRALFLDRAAHALRMQADQPDHDVAVAFIDLDQFKQVNDGLGHNAGDDVLQAVGERLRTCVRGSDTIARLGGDEFVVLIQRCAGVLGAIDAVERILGVFDLPFGAGGLEVNLRASAGVAIARPEDTAADLLRHADIAMYEAKGSGRSGYQLFDPSMKSAATTRIGLRSDLDRAIEEKQFSLVYQPIVELKSGRLKGAEALLRWQHPERGAISPVDFIPIAEQSGRIVEIGHWVLEEACKTAALWQAAETALTINVNVSAIQLRDARLIERVRSALLGTRLEPGRLTLEITETAMMDSPETTAEILKSLRELGVRIAIDDFGTGYCSLAYLRRFTVDFLKIDRAFVTEVKADSERLLAHNILDMAENLGVTAVAEGIESDAQLANLRDHGCEYGQGYYFAASLSPQDFIAQSTRKDQAVAR